MTLIERLELGGPNAMEVAGEAAAEIKRLLGIFQGIMDGFGPNHLSKFCRDEAERALTGAVVNKVVTDWTEADRKMVDDLRAIRSADRP